MYRSNKISLSNCPPKTPWYRLVWAFLFRGLNGKLKRHWLRSLTEREAAEGGLSIWSAWAVEGSRRKKHIESIKKPLNYNRTKFKPVL